MVDRFYVGSILTYFVYVILGLLAMVYSLLIMWNRQFHHRNNMFILNICFTFLVGAIYFIIFHVVIDPNPFPLMDRPVCLFFYYMFLTCASGAPISCVTFSVHRLCSLRYHMNPFFKSKQWVGISIACQWIIVYVLAFPFLFRQQLPVCILEIWMKIYILIAIVIIPTTTIVIVHFLIFIYVRASTRRVHLQSEERPTDTNHPKQYGKLSRRDRALLYQMILMFCILVMGGLPVYLSLIIAEFIPIDVFVFVITGMISELGLLIIIMNLFIQNHELKQYLRNKIRQIFIRY